MNFEYDMVYCVDQFNTHTKEWQRVSKYYSRSNEAVRYVNQHKKYNKDAKFVIQGYELHLAESKEV